MKSSDVIKNFDSKKDMTDYRNNMLDEAENLLNAGKMEEYDAKMLDIEQFDSEYAEYAEKRANIAAMRSAPAGVPLDAITAESIAMNIADKRDNNNCHLCNK